MTTNNYPPVVIIVIIITTMIYNSCTSGISSESKEQQVQPISLPVQKLDTGSAVLVNNYFGKIEGKINVEIRPEVEGLLREIYVDEGDFVDQGQNLFKIDPSSYQEELQQYDRYRKRGPCKTRKCRP